MLTSADSHLLSDGSTVAPTNHYLTYEGDGNDFLIEVRQLMLDAAPALVDGAFSFAYVGFDGDVRVVPESATGLLLAVALLCWPVFRRR